MPNIADANFNKNYLTARSPARARSCSPALVSENSTIVNKLVNNSENTFSSKKTLIPM